MKRFYVTGPHAPHGAVGRWAVRDRATGKGQPDGGHLIHEVVDIARRKEDALAAAREHNAARETT